MTIAEIQQEILRMKKEQDICILAHAYQGQEILEVADYTGDSYGLSVQASKRDCIHSFPTRRSSDLRKSVV